MDREVKKTKKLLSSNKGFTLVEVIAVLVILGILAAVAIPKFFDMQDTARYKTLVAAVGELNGQIALSFAQNSLENGPKGGCKGFDASLGTDFTITGGVGTTPAGFPCGASGR